MKALVTKDKGLIDESISDKCQLCNARESPTKGEALVELRHKP